MTSGYSGTPLIKKLGIKPGFKVKVVNPPVDYLELLGSPADITLLEGDQSDLDFVHIFTKEKASLEGQLTKLKSRIKPGGMIWVSWPKGSSRVPTDLNENIVREVALAQGMVDVKVAAIDETWSGLKLVYRLKDRPR